MITRKNLMAASLAAAAFWAAQASGNNSAQAGKEGGKELEAARKRFLETCAGCHGSEGRGDGPGARNLPVKPQDFTDAAYMGGLTDEHLAKVITGGGVAVGKPPFMPAFGAVLSKEEISGLVAYIRSLAAKRKGDLLP